MVNIKCREHKGFHIDDVIGLDWEENEGNEVWGFKKETLIP